MFTIELSNVYSFRQWSKLAYEYSETRDNTSINTIINITGVGIKISSWTYCAEILGFVFLLSHICSVQTHCMCIVKVYKNIMSTAIAIYCLHM